MAEILKTAVTHFDVPALDQPTASRWGQARWGEARWSDDLWDGIPFAPGSTSISAVWIPSPDNHRIAEFAPDDWGALVGQFVDRERAAFPSETIAPDGILNFRPLMEAAASDVWLMVRPPEIAAAAGDVEPNINPSDRRAIFNRDLLAITEIINADQSILIHNSPPKWLPTKALLKTSPVIVLTAMTLFYATSVHPLLFLATPFGVILIGGALGVAEGLRNGLREKMEKALGDGKSRGKKKK